MSKIRFTEDNYKNEPFFRALCRALHSCQNETEVSDLLGDVGTLKELQIWSERLEMAKQLAKGFTYRKVAENTGASTATVTRVAKTLENGTGGYRRFLNVHRHHRLNSGRIIIDEEGEKKYGVLRKYL